jgi:hypothetical protein
MNYKKLIAALAKKDTLERSGCDLRKTGQSKLPTIRQCTTFPFFRNFHPAPQVLLVADVCFVCEKVDTVHLVAVEAKAHVFAIIAVCDSGAFMRLA